MSGVNVLRRALTSRFAIVWYAIIAMFVICLVVVPGAVAPGPLAQSLPFVGVLAITAIGQTLVVQQRGVDFSVPGVVVMSGIIVAALCSRGVDTGLAIGIGILSGAIAGLLNGIVVVYFALTPLVATLASNGIYIAVALIVSGGFPIDASAALRAISRADLLGVSVSAWAALFVVIVVAVLMKYTVAGRRFVAVGSNGSTALVARIVVNRYRVGAYVIAGALYAVGGALLTGYVGSARMDMGTTYLLASIAAVVIGGTPLTGGRGSVVASVGGAAFQSLLTVLVLGLGAPTTVQLLAQSAALVIAVAAPGVVARVNERRHRPAIASPSPSARVEAATADA
jgi:ribose transport system permease protein